MNQDLINKDKTEAAFSTNDSIFLNEVPNEDDILINRTDHEDIGRLDWLPFKENESVQLFFNEHDSNYHSSEFRHLIQHQSQCSIVKEIRKIDSSENNPKQTKLKSKKKKNSNGIKANGRIILQNLKQYDLGQLENKGTSRMLNQLSKLTNKLHLKDIKDGFNTSHLKELFLTDQPDSIIGSYNLAASKRIFRNKVRRYVLRSSQIKGDNILLYLNTLKCTSLRFFNKTLATRLQMCETSL